MINGKRIAVVLPAYNAEKTLEATVRELPQLVDIRILVDDGSSDATALPDALDNSYLFRHFEHTPGRALADGGKAAMTVTSCLAEASHRGAVGPLQPPAERLKALIFDVDGTLYEQGPVQRAMLYRILRAHWRNPAQGFRTLRSLYAYRVAQEELRKTPSGVGDIASAQLRLASKRVGIGAEAIASDVARWMEQEPLPLLVSSRRRGLVELLQRAKRSGLQLAAFSDYPADQKLVAMGIVDFFDVVVSAQDPEVQRFKPDPKGLEITLRRLKVRNHEAIYIGDRAAVDAAAAARAGIRHLILSDRENFAELSDSLVPRGSAEGCTKADGEL